MSEPIGKLNARNRFEACRRARQGAGCRNNDWSPDSAALKLAALLVFADATSVPAAHIAEDFEWLIMSRPAARISGC